MKHLFIFTLLFLLNLISYSQIKQTEAERKVKVEKIFKREEYRTDSNNVTFLSAVINYDTLGRVVNEVTYNSGNKVKEENRSIFIGDTIIITIYYEAERIDTSVCKFDNLGRKYCESWIWFDDKNIDESWYYYKGNTDTLLVSIDKYRTGARVDSFFYKAGYLIQILTYENDLQSEVHNYKYTNGLLSLKTRESLPMGKRLLSKESYFYDSAGNMDKTVIEYPDHKMRIESCCKYDSKKIKKFEKMTVYNDDKVQRTVEERYGKSGLMELKIEVYAGGKQEKVRYKYYKIK